MVGCVTAVGGHRGVTVNYVDLDRFMGKWYVIASIPTMFEKNATNAVETYTRNNDGTIHVDFTYNKKGPAGRLKKMTQKAFVIDSETNAHWKIRPLWPFLFDYLIIDLDQKNYEYTVIGRPNKANVWIMARNPTMPEKVYQKLVNKIENDGYDISQLKRVPQKWK